MADPGHSYLYNKSPMRPSTGAGGGSRGAPSPLAGAATDAAGAVRASSVTPPHSRLHHGSRSMTAPEPGHLTANGQLGRWEAALGNVEDARVALEWLALMVDDAVYLDEDTYNQVQPKVAYVKTIQAQQARIAALTAENRDLQKRLESAEHHRRRSNQQVEQVQSELENNSAVFKLHYSEILAKNEEIERLKAVIEGLSSNSGRGQS